MIKAHENKFWYKTALSKCHFLIFNIKFLFPKGKKFEVCSRTSLSVIWNMFDDVSCGVKMENFSRKYKLVHG